MANEKKTEPTTPLVITASGDKQVVDDLAAMIESLTSKDVFVVPNAPGVLIAALIARQAKWSQATFGSDEVRGPIGPLKHLLKELTTEVLGVADYMTVEAIMGLDIKGGEGLDDIVEWGDMLLLLLDAIRRKGFTWEGVVVAAWNKMDVNEQREWPPDPTNQRPVEHVKLGPAAALTGAKSTGGMPKILTAMGLCPVCKEQAPLSSIAPPVIGQHGVGEADGWCEGTGQKPALDINHKCIRLPQRAGQSEAYSCLACGLGIVYLPHNEKKWPQIKADFFLIHGEPRI